jgi:hypothetical protein
VEATGDEHHEVGETGSGVAKAVLDNTAALDAGNDVFNRSTEAGEQRVAPLLTRVEFLSTRFLLRLVDD